MGRGFVESMSDAMTDLRADYDGAKLSQHIRRRTRLGGSGDAKLK